ncbi:hypothetical protein K3495_g12449 [Podosphaera aphanis]|nr:hypothetical protein K3495_g12449 [Podosphaera aphanis]
MLKDTHDYIEGCLTCAKHGTALRSKTLSKFLVSSPNEVWGIDFIGPFPKAEKSKYRYILLIVDYFTRFVWTYPCVTNNSEETIQFLGEIFEKEGIPVGIYADEGPHFQKATREFCRKAGVVWIPALVAAKRSVGMVEKANDLLQRVLVKGGDSSDWSLRFNRSTFLLNRREMAYLGFSPFELHRGYLPESTLSSSFPSHQRHILAARLENIGPDFFEGFTPPPDDHVNAAIARVLSLQEQFDKVRVLTSIARERQKARFDRGVKQRAFHPGQLVMLYDGSLAKKKLRPSWRGPFVITGPGGDHGRSFKVRQIDGSPILRTYHGDHLKVFRLREGYLRTGEEETLPTYQNIRLGKAYHKLPKLTRHRPGVLGDLFEYTSGIMELFSETEQVLEAS